MHQDDYLRSGLSAEGDISEYGVESGHQQRHPFSVDRILAICFEAAYSETLIVHLSQHIS